MAGLEEFMYVFVLYFIGMGEAFIRPAKKQGGPRTVASQENYKELKKNYEELKENYDNLLVNHQGLAECFECLERMILQTGGSTTCS